MKKEFQDARRSQPINVSRSEQRPLEWRENQEERPLLLVPQLDATENVFTDIFGPRIVSYDPKRRFWQFYQNKFKDQNQFLSARERNVTFPIY